MARARPAFSFSSLLVGGSSSVNGGNKGSVVCGESHAVGEFGGR